MDCQFINENIIDYLEEQLSPDDLEKFRDHLERCQSCRQLLNEVSLTYPFAARPADFKINENFVELALRRMQKKEARIIPLVTRVLKPIAVAASIGMGILIGNGELSVLNEPNNEVPIDELALSVSAPSDYSVWQTLEEDYGTQD